MITRRLISILIGVYAWNTAWGAEDFSAFLGDTKIIGFAKAMYVNDDRKGGRLDWNTPGFGGKLGFETGSLYGLQFKVAEYGVTDFGLRDKNFAKIDGYMYRLDTREPFALLGEAAVLYKFDKTAFNLGRQEMANPQMSTYDARIVPNLFEAYTVTNNNIDNTTVTFSYVDRMAGLDGLISNSKFVSMSQQTYTSLSLSNTNPNVIDSNFLTTGSSFNLGKVVGDKGIFMLGINYDKDPITVQGWDYHMPDAINSLYMDFAYKYDINPNLQLTLGAQGYAANSIGEYDDFLGTLGLNGDYQLFGVQGVLLNKELGINITAAYDQFTGDK